MTAIVAEFQSLPRPGPFAALFDGQPWLVSAVLVLAGLAAWYILRNQNQPRRAAAAAFVSVALAVGLNIAARMIVTERERVSEATLELVRATASGDPARLSPLLAADAVAIANQSFPGVPIPRDGMGKDALLELVSRTLGGTYAVKEYGVLETQAQVTGASAARTHVRVRVTPRYTEAPVLSWWRIDWRKSGDQWQAVLIEPLDFGTVRSLMGR